MHKLLKTSILIILAFYLALLAGCGSNNNSADSSHGYDITDAHGTVTHFDKPPEKILTLSMSTDEIVLGLVKSDRLVGINALLDDPNNSNIVNIAKKIPKKIKNPTAEEILAMHPDVVFIPDWGQANISQNLRDMGIKVVVTKGAKTVDDVQYNIKLISNTLGIPDKGQELIKMMDNRLAEIKAKVAKIPENQRKKVVLISVMPAYGGIGSSFDNSCKVAGVINGRAEAGIKDGQTMSKEMLLKINPDILLLPKFNDHGKFDTKKFNDNYLKDPSLQTLKAIKDKQILYPREAYLYNVSQDIVFGIQEIARCAYGKDFDFPDNEHLSISDENN